MEFLLLYYNRKLQLNRRTREELETMLEKHEGSLYKRVCDFFNIHPSRKYDAKMDALEIAITYRLRMEDRAKQA